MSGRRPLRVAVAGGGTGGHTSPAVAVLEAIRAREPDLAAIWIGKRGGIEERVSASVGVPFAAVAAEGWPRGGGVRRVRVLFRLALGLVQSLWVLARFRPDAVIGVGGYVSLPPLLAARLRGTPIFLHEQNKRLGLANRVAAPAARRVYLSFEDTLGVPRGARALLTGNPVRAGFRAPPDPAEARARLEFAPDVPLVLVVGGSQGATSINRAVTRLSQQLARDEAQLLWMTGSRDHAQGQAAASAATATVVARPFIDDMVTACAAADLLVCRAGASTTAEIACLGKPALLIPYPHAADDHQADNARALEAAGAAVVLADAHCGPQTLGEAVRGLLADPDRLAAMGAAARALARPDAADAIADDLLAALGRA